MKVSLLLSISLPLGVLGVTHESWIPKASDDDIEQCICDVLNAADKYAKKYAKAKTWKERQKCSVNYQQQLKMLDQEDACVSLDARPTGIHEIVRTKCQAGDCRDAIVEYVTSLYPQFADMTCPEPSPCCDTNLEPGSPCGEVPACPFGHGCCDDGKWTCRTKQGKYVCGWRWLDEAPGTVCPVTCDLDVRPCSDGSSVGRDPDLCCDFPSCPEDNIVVAETNTDLPTLEPTAGMPPVDQPVDSGSLPDELESQPQNQEMICCDPMEEPGMCGNRACSKGAACCSNGEWTCQLPDGSYLCEDSVMKQPSGEVCEAGPCPADMTEITCPDGKTVVKPDPEYCCEYPKCPPMGNGRGYRMRPDFVKDTKIQTEDDILMCCDPNSEPGICNNLPCTSGFSACCENGSWTCLNSNGKYVCNGVEMVYTTGRVCEFDSTGCALDIKICSGSRMVLRRDAENCCLFPECPPLTE